MTGTSKFRSTVWDPLLIIFQIISMQLQFYFTLALIIYILHFLQTTTNTNTNIYSLEKIFNFKSINFIQINGRLITFAFLVNSIVSALFECYIINRTKQCLDFTVTVHIYHILACWVYMSSFPNTFSFWFIIILSTVIMTLLSEYLCMKSELKEIPLSLIPKANV